MSDALFFAELTERLFVHYAQSSWRAPLGQRSLAIAAPRHAHVICADPSDIDRALMGLGQGAPSASALMVAVQVILPSLGALRAAEGHVVGDMAVSPVTLPGQGPVMLLSAASAPVGAVLSVLLLAAQGRGVIWKPAPQTAASAHLLMRALGPLAQGNLALVQGDHATGATMAERGTAVWLSDAPVPAGLAATIP